MITPHKLIPGISYPGSEVVGHDWAYLPDVGEAFARLMDRDDELEPSARFHFRGNWDSDGTLMTSAIKRVVGKPSLPVKGIPRFIFRIASPFNETLRELYAVHPLWQTAIARQHEIDRFPWRRAANLSR